MTKPTLMDAFSAAANFGNTALNIYDRKQKEVAEADLRAQQLDLEVWQNETLQEIQRSPDYENYEQMYKDAWRKKYEEYNSITGLNAYKNNYTAKAGNQMFDSMQANAQIKLLQAKTQRMDMNRIEKDNSTVTKLNELYPAGQERLNLKKDIYERQYADGVITEAQRNQALEKNAAEEIMDTTQAYTLAYLTKNPHLTEGEALENLGKYQTDLNLSVNGYEIPLDKNAYVQKGIQNAFRKINEIQSQNNSDIKGQNTIILDDWRMGINNASGDESRISNVCNTYRNKAVAQISKLRSMGALEITEDDRRTRITELEGILQDIDGYKNLKGGSKGAVNKHITMEEYVRQKKQTISNGDVLREGIKEGYTINEIIKGFQEQFKVDEIQHLTDWMEDAAEKGIDYTDDRAAYWTQLDNKLIEECAKYTGLNAEQKQSIENARQFYLKSQNLKKSDDLFNAWLGDTVASISLSNFKSGNELTDYLQKRIGDFIIANSLDFSRAFTAKKFLGGEKDVTDMTEKDLINAVKQGQNSELLWTEGNSHNAGDLVNQDNAEKVINTLKNSNTSSALRLDVLSNLNAKAGKKLNWSECVHESIATTDDGSDLEPYLTYTISNTGTELDGKTLRYVTDGKNLVLQSKPKDYTWSKAEKEGVLKEVTRNKFDDTIKKVKKDTEGEKIKEQVSARNSSKEAGAKAKAVTKEAREELKARLNAQGEEVDKAVSMVNGGYKPNSVYPYIWSNMSLDEKVEYLYTHKLIK